MWNKLTLQTKITISTAIVLSLITICLTAMSIHNASLIFVISMEDFVIPSDYGDLTGGGGDKIPIHGEALYDSDVDKIKFITDQSQSDFKMQSILTAIVFVIIGTISAYFISGRTLKPVSTLTKRIEDIDENNLKTQIEAVSGRDEVARLTHSFNNMLAKLNRSFEIQRLFAQNAAHELKTPLSAIRAHIEVLQMDKQPSVSEYEEVIETIKKSTERLIDLVGGLLSLNSVVDESKRKTFSGKGLIHNIIKDLTQNILDKEIDVSIDGDCRINGDRDLLEMAFFNIVHNAVRYNVKGGYIKILLDVGCIIVSDGGVGIPKENIDYLFEPFYCVDASRSKKLGGNGLGLSITKNILEKHGMKIVVDSEAGRGTIFMVKW